MNDSPAIWRKSAEVNYEGLVSLTLKGIKHMNKEEGGKGGTIINIASTTVFMINTFLPIYAGTKAAVLHFTRSVATGLTEQSGVRLMTMCFGGTNTPLVDNLDKLTYDPKVGKTLADFANEHIMQKAESGIKGVVDVFKQGSHKTVWVSTDDKPAEDITSLLNNAFEIIQKALYPSLPSFSKT